MNLNFFETSAKDNKNVYETFYAVTRLALLNRLQAREKSPSNDLTSQTIRLKTKKKDKKHHGSCCK